ncbi:MAG: hypothetical protein QM744_02800 [Mesorhizobium sp.]
MNMSELQRQYLWSRGASSFEDLQSPIERLEFANRAAQPDPRPSVTEANRLPNDGTPLALDPLKIEQFSPVSRMHLQARLEQLSIIRKDRATGNSTVSDEAFVAHCRELAHLADDRTAQILQNMIAFYE